MRAEGNIGRLTGFRNGSEIWSRLILDIDRPPEEVESLTKGSVDVRIDIHRNHRSLDANAALWHCIDVIAKSLGRTKDDIYLEELREYGKFVTLSVIPIAYKELQRAYRLCEIAGDTEMIHPKTGELQEVVIVKCYIGSSSYNSKEFSELLNGVIDDMKQMGLGQEAPTSAEIKRIIADLEERDKKESGYG